MCAHAIRIGIWELLILLLVLLVIFGPKRLPEMGKRLGKGMREFKDSVTGNDKDEDDLYASELPPAEPVTATTSGSARAGLGLLKPPSDDPQDRPAPPRLG